MLRFFLLSSEEKKTSCHSLFKQNTQHKITFLMCIKPPFFRIDLTNLIIPPYTVTVQVDDKQIKSSKTFVMISGALVLTNVFIRSETTYFMRQGNIREEKV